MHFDELTEKNLVMFAMRNYDVSSCIDTKEFFSDLHKVRYLKKLFSLYIDHGELKERLILNHLITFYNVFEPISATRILFFEMDKRHHSILKTFLLFMNKFPDYIPGKESVSLNRIEIPFDNVVIEKLREI